MPQTIHFIITGGTIDSYYDGTRDTAVTNEKSIIPEFIKSLKLPSKNKFTTVCLKDSRQITKTDLKRILGAVEKSQSRHIIITHGTYTMPDTARYLKANLKRRDQTIILTGSLIPIVGFSPSDGGFNIGYAIGKLDNLPKGVYVCMNGRTFTPEEVLKIVNEGRFDSVFGESSNITFRKS